MDLVLKAYFDFIPNLENELFSWCAESLICMECAYQLPQVKQTGATW